MARIIAREDYAKLVGGGSCSSYETNRGVTKLRALNMGASITNAGNYSSNQLVAKEDLYRTYCSCDEVCRGYNSCPTYSNCVCHNDCSKCDYTACNCENQCSDGCSSKSACSCKNDTCPSYCISNTYNCTSHCDGYGACSCEGQCSDGCGSKAACTCKNDTCPTYCGSQCYGNQSSCGYCDSYNACSTNCPSLTTCTCNGNCSTTCKSQYYCTHCFSEKTCSCDGYCTLYTIWGGSGFGHNCNPDEGRGGCDVTLGPCGPICLCTGVCYVCNSQGGLLCYSFTWCSGHCHYYGETSYGCRPNCSECSVNCSQSLCKSVSYTCSCNNDKCPSYCTSNSYNCTSHCDGYKACSCEGQCNNGCSKAACTCKNDTCPTYCGSKCINCTGHCDSKVACSCEGLCSDGCSSKSSCACKNDCSKCDYTACSCYTLNCAHCSCNGESLYSTCVIV